MHTYNDILEGIPKRIRRLLRPDKKTCVKYGDIIGVRRTGYKHFGVYVNEDTVIHYGAKHGRKAGSICIREVTFNEFLGDSKSYFICEFPAVHGKPREIDIKRTHIDTIVDLMKKGEYKLYSPQETVERAISRLGETQYNLFKNNCEHFSLWCKTGISESYQMERIIDILTFKNM